MKSIKDRLIFGFILTSVVISVVVGGFSINRQMEIGEENINTYRETLFTEYDRGIKTDVEIAISLIEKIHKEQQAGLFTEEEA